MARNLRFSSMHNRAKLMVLKRNYPELAKGLVEYIYKNKMLNKNAEELAFEVGRHSICGSTITDYLKQESMLDTVNNIVNELAYSARNIAITRDLHSKIDNHIKKNKSFANQLLVESVVRSNTEQLFLSAVDNKGSIAKRFMMKVGSSLNLGEDCRRDAVFSEILKGMNKETFARRNKNGDARTMGAGNIEASSALTEDVIAVAKENNITLVDELTQKFESMKKKLVHAGKSALVVGGLMSVFVFGATANSPTQQINIDHYLNKANIEQSVIESVGDQLELLTNTNKITTSEKQVIGAFSEDNLPFVAIDPILEQYEDEKLKESLSRVSTSINNGKFIVEDGDNLSKLSESILDEIYGDYVTVLTSNEYQKEILNINEQLVQVNNLDNPDLIFPEQQLNIPENIKVMMTLNIDQRVDILAEKISEKSSNKFKITI